jgi:hypothetical protein
MTASDYRYLAESPPTISPPSAEPVDEFHFELQRIAAKTYAKKGGDNSEVYKGRQIGLSMAEVNAGIGKEAGWCCE